ncbi:MAG: DUF2079 domain-containing protein [Candidatus Parvarchaeota archaeon]
MRFITSASRSDKILFALLTAANASYVVYWSIFSIDRFYSLHAYVYDLGIAMESGWLIFHTHWTLLYFFKSFYALSGRILLSPLFIGANFPFILVVQTIAISSGSIFIFLAAKIVFRNNVLSILLATSYLIYFPLAGPNFYDFHYQVFFIPFFLAGFYYYLKGEYIISIVLMTISGLFRFPYMAFPAAFAVIEMATIFVREKKHAFEIERKRLKFLLYGFFTFSAFLLFGYLSLLSASSGQAGAILSLTHGNFFSLSNIRVDLDIKIFTVMLILGGLLFLPLKSKYMLLTLPFFFFVFFYDFKSYYYPRVLQVQYASALVPFLYIAIIDALRSSIVVKEEESNEKEGGTREIYKKVRKNALKDVIALLIVLILFTQVFEPYGALNGYTEDSFGASYVMNVSMPDFNVFENAIKLIPRDTPANEVFVGENLPFVYPLPVNSSSPLSPIQSMVYNDTTFFYNYTELGSDGKYYPILPKYVVMYPYGSYGPQDRFGYFGYVNQISSYPNNVSDYDIVAHLMETGDYGILAEADGLFILERGYHGPLKYYVPFYRFYGYNDFIPGTDSKVTSRGISIGVSIPGLFFYGPPTALSPGNYTVTYFFKLIGDNTSGIINLRSYYGAGYQFFSEIASFNSTATKAGAFKVTYAFSSSTFTSNDQFVAYMVKLYGTIVFEGVAIDQVSGPS